MRNLHPKCNKCYFSITEPIFELGDKLLPVYNMASSGLKKMLFYTILRHSKCVWENVMTNNIFVFYFCKIIFKADVMPFYVINRCYIWQMLLPCDKWWMLNH